MLDNAALKEIAEKVVTLGAKRNAVAHRGKPLLVVGDNGTELTSSAILRWSQEQKVEWHYIAPGNPT